MHSSTSARRPLSLATLLRALVPWSAVASAQTPSRPGLRVGSIEGILGDYSAEIRRSQKVWEVDLTNSVRNNDCDILFLENERICLGKPKAPCPECRRYTTLVAWDERHQKLYFGVGTMFSWEKPYAIFSYSLLTRRISRFINTWTGGFWQGCCVDQWAVSGIPENAPQRAGGAMEGAFFFDRLTWSSRSMLEYSVIRHVPESCAPAPGEAPLIGQIDSGKLDFR